MDQKFSVVPHKMLAPARRGCCGIRLPTAVSLIVALDLFRTILAGSALVMAVTQHSPVHFSSLVYLSLLLLGATLGIWGLSHNSPKALNLYASVTVLRIFAAVLIAATFISHLTESVTAMVDAIIEKASEEARRHNQPQPEIDREAMISGAVKAVTVVTVAGECMSACVSFYCAHLIRSLAFWMREGTGEAPLLYRYVAQPTEPLVHESRV